MQNRLLIVLGYTLTIDGSIPAILKSRLDEAISIYHPTDTILVCGKRPPRVMAPMRCEHMTEAEAMKQYLMLCNIPESRILKEEESATTFGNALFSRLNLLEGITTYSQIIVISNEFHIPLVKYCFDKVLGDRYFYILHSIPDITLGIALEEIKKWKNVIRQLIEKCYPLLFTGIQDGDINAIQSIIESPRRVLFENSVKKLLHLDPCSNVVIASEAEIRIDQ